MKCQDLMSTDVSWVPGTATVLEASRVMRDLSLGFLLVSDPVPGQAVGVVTNRDLATRVCAEGLDPREVRVGTVATLELVMCADRDDLKVAEARMIESQKSQLVVIDDDRQIVGLLGLTEVLRGDHGRRALKTANAVLSRGVGRLQASLESIHLTPSTVAEEARATNRETIMVGGDHRGSMREFGA